MWLRVLSERHVEAVADELSVPTVGMLARRPLLFKQPAAFSLATGAAAASPTATVEQEYGGRNRSQEVRAAAQRPLSKTLASRSECMSWSKHLVCVFVCVGVWFLSASVSPRQPDYVECVSVSVSEHLCLHLCFSLFVCTCQCVCLCAHLHEL